MGVSPRRCLATASLAVGVGSRRIRGGLYLLWERGRCNASESQRAERGSRLHGFQSHLRGTGEERISSSRTCSRQLALILSGAARCAVLVHTRANALPT